MIEQQCIVGLLVGETKSTQKIKHELPTQRQGISVYIVTVVGAPCNETYTLGSWTDIPRMLENLHSTEMCPVAMVT